MIDIQAYIEKKKEAGAELRKIVEQLNEIFIGFSDAGITILDNNDCEMEKITFCVKNFNTISMDFE